MKAQKSGLAEAASQGRWSPTLLGSLLGIAVAALGAYLLLRFLGY